jgi:hypothetical protein
MFTYKKYTYPQANTTPQYKMSSPAYIHQMPQSTTHGASRAPSPAPPSGSGVSPPPAPRGGGPPPVGPSCLGDSRSVVNAASTDARRTMAHHGGGTPTHCSRKVSSWMRDHMPSGTSYNIVSRRWCMSS